MCGGLEISSGTARHGIFDIVSPGARRNTGCAEADTEFPVVTGAGSHPFPFRTRKLSLLPPMVLRGKLRGRVGRCREFFPARRSNRASGFFVVRQLRARVRCPCSAGTQEKTFSEKLQRLRVVDETSRRPPPARKRTNLSGSERWRQEPALVRSVPPPGRPGVGGAVRRRKDPACELLNVFSSWRASSSRPRRFRRARSPLLLRALRASPSASLARATTLSPD